MIRVRNLHTQFGQHVIHQGVNLEIQEREIYAILGQSGSGKSVLMKEIIRLLEPTGGTIEILGKDISKMGLREVEVLKQQWGVLFQFGALFSSLSVAQNIEIQLKEYTKISQHIRDKIVSAKLELVGLEPRVGALYPSELSGGMVKRVALARALAMDPSILFLDEPTSGLDPIGARNFDRLIYELRELLGVTVVMITHDVQSIRSIVDRMAILADKQVVVEGSMKSVLQSSHPFVNDFFKGKE